MIPHPQIAGYMRRHGIPATRLRADGRLTLVMGQRYRMHLQPLPGGGLAFESRLLPLPTGRAERARCIDHLLRVSASRLRGHPEVCCIDRAAQQAMLQHMVPAELSPVAFDEAVARFMRATVFWKHAGLDS